MGNQAESEFLNAEDVQVPKGCPKAALWRVLVAPVRPMSKSRGGIELPTIVGENAEHFTYIGKIVSIGPMAGIKDGWPAGAWPYKVGDWVLFGRYAGQRFEYQGVKLLILDDDNILAEAVSGPDGFRIYL